MRTLLAALACLAAAPSFAAPLPFPTFKAQEIDKTLKVGYGLRVVDLNNDQKLDVVVADANRVVWFDNAGGWKLRTIIDNSKAGVKPDNVCLAVHDIDGDGKLDVALGADWQINNTAAGGSLQWLRQGADIDEPWAVHKLAESIPTLHRIHFGDLDLDRDGKPELLVAPIRGKGSTLRENWMDKPVQLLSYAIPKDPAGAWGEPKVIDESTHQTHNFTLLDPGVSGGMAMLTASAEGIGAIMDQGGKRSWHHIGRGNQDNPKGARGSGEVKVGSADSRPAFLVAIEPLHGHQLVGYQFRTVAVRTDDQGNPLPGPPPGPDDHLAVRTVIDDKLKGGHALWCADLDGDGTDEVITGAREGEPGGGRGVNAYKTADAGGGPPVFEKHVIDDKDMACEDLACADLNGDGKVDIVAAGRATGNVRIYWNEGVPAAKP